MLFLIQGWRLNRRVKQCLQLPVPSAGPVLMAVFLGLIVGYLVSYGEVPLPRFEALGILALAAFLTAVLLNKWPDNPQNIILVPVPYAPPADNFATRLALTPASLMNGCFSSRPRLWSGHLLITLPDGPPAGTASADALGERMAELAALYEQFESKETLCRQLLGKVLTAQEEERTRLARELHDTIGQSLTAIIMTTAAVEKNFPPGFPSGQEQLASVRAVARQALQDLRNLIFDLRPDILDDLGLTLAVRNQAKKYLEATGVQVRFRMAITDELSPEVEITVFRVVQEAITNIFRHAEATEVYISLTNKNGRLIVRVEDDGKGFDPVQVMNGQRHCWGLHGMKERINLLGGKFYVGSRPGSGTLVMAEVPLETSLLIRKS